MLYRINACLGSYATALGSGSKRCAPRSRRSGRDGGEGERSPLPFLQAEYSIRLLRREAASPAFGMGALDDGSNRQWSELYEKWLFSLMFCSSAFFVVRSLSHDCDACRTTLAPCKDRASSRPRARGARVAVQSAMWPAALQPPPHPPVYHKT